MSNRIPDSKVKQILKFSMVDGVVVNEAALARRLNVSRNTLKKYFFFINRFKKQFPDIQTVEQLSKNFKILQKQQPVKYLELLKLFPIILQRIERGETRIGQEWYLYKRNFENGYSKSQFVQHFRAWLNSKGYFGNPYNKWTVELSETDIPRIRKLSRSSSHRKWERAITVLDANNNVRIETIANKLGRTKEAVRDWIRIYQKSGFDGLFNKPRKKNEAILNHADVRKSNLMKLIHQTPHIHGINRASWSLATLANAYCQTYNDSISTSTISKYIRMEGFSFKMAKETLTSPDPLYKEKLKKITAILSTLGNKEKFFSIDEYGPFSVKKKGGRVLARNGETVTYPQFQKSKGWLICTAALELSTNQITHFYSRKKDTDEMIKLLNILILEYADQEKIYLSWDSASWHASKKLYRYIDEVNNPNLKTDKKCPLVELAPLPSSAQFLNVIESVFSGMSKAVIHNSDYASVAECKAAIDRYFSDRNIHFKENPKRAGNKIWGKERVPPVFRENNNCKGQSWG